eukprot:SAG22_NODE_46_length_24705_cov_89.861010_8_plen_216_part_00
MKLCRVVEVLCNLRQLQLSGTSMSLSMTLVPGASRHLYSLNLPRKRPSHFDRPRSSSPPSIHNLRTRTRRRAAGPAVYVSGCHHGLSGQGAPPPCARQAGPSRPSPLPRARRKTVLSSRTAQLNWMLSAHYRHTGKLCAAQHVPAGEELAELAGREEPVHQPAIQPDAGRAAGPAAGPGGAPPAPPIVLCHSNPNGCHSHHMPTHNPTGTEEALA